MAVEEIKLKSWRLTYQSNCNAKIEKFKLSLKNEISANNMILPAVEIVLLNQVSGMNK